MKYSRKFKIVDMAELIMLYLFIYNIIPQKTNAFNIKRQFAHAVS